MNKIGVFGGTFNPVHKGHELAAVEFYTKLNLDKLLIIPANIPPHKKSCGDISPMSRLEMCGICFDKYKNYNIEVSDIEIKKSGVSYTFDTLESLLKIYQKDFNIIYFLVGSDMFLYLEKWHKYKELLDMCVFTVAFRNNTESPENSEVLKLRDKLANQGYKTELLNNKAFEISSTELREKLNSGLDSADYLSPEVLDYIKEKNLYVLQ